MAALSGQHAFKLINWVLNSGRKQELLNMIEDDNFRDCLSCALHENQDERSDLK